jgi:hypothetical protein
MTVKRSLIVSAIILSTAAWPAGLAAQGQSQGRGRGNGGDKSQPETAVFREGDQATFHNYFVTHKITAQPLPPGIAKNVARGKPLPPGIAKRALPADLLAVAPRVDKDVSFAIVGEAVVALKSGVVIDILAGVFVK